jgi:hypothetical protein
MERKKPSKEQQERMASAKDRGKWVSMGEEGVRAFVAAEGPFRDQLSLMVADRHARLDKTTLKTLTGIRNMIEKLLARNKT